MLVLGATNGELDGSPQALASVPFAGILVILFSCVTGLMIGYTGWKCRSLISATTFTLVGVVNKFLTILLNVLIWDKHSTSFGLGAVCCCLLAGSFYQQAPMRETMDAEREKEEQIELLSNTNTSTSTSSGKV